MNPSAPTKYEKYATSGIVAVKCKHDLFESVADMEGGGER